MTSGNQQRKQAREPIGGTSATGRSQRPAVQGKRKGVLAWLFGKAVREAMKRSE